MASGRRVRLLAIRPLLRLDAYRVDHHNISFQRKGGRRVVPSTKMPLGNSEFDMPGLLETTTSVNRAELVMKLDRSMGSRVLPLTIGVEFSDPISPVSKSIACSPSQGARRLTC
jgi:hypothetical protein